MHIICIISAASGNPYQKLTSTSNKINKKRKEENFDPTTIRPLLIIAGLVVIALIANRIDEKSIGNFFQNSDSNTEEKIPNSKPDYTQAQLDSMQQVKQIKKLKRGGRMGCKGIREGHT